MIDPELYWHPHGRLPQEPWPDNLFDGMGEFPVILADPPWLFKNYSKKGEKKNANQHYECLPTTQIAALPVRKLAPKVGALFMWATFPMLKDAFLVMEKWGYEYRAAAPWAKQSKTGRTWAFGGGYIFRATSEILLVGCRGKPTRKSKSIRNLIVAPVREHSRKPDVTFEMVEALYDGPYLELFARQARPGWKRWGKEAPPEVAALGEAPEARAEAEQVD